MANVDAPFGLRPVRTLSGASWNGQATKYYVPSTDANAMFIGDPVDLAGAADATGMYPTVQKATLADGNYTIGPIVAIEPDETYTTTYRAASTARYVWVADDPNLIFQIQCDSASTFTAADIGLNGIMVATHSGSTVTGLSGIEYDESSSAANASNMLLVLRGANIPDNDPLLDHGIIEVLISLHRYRTSGAGEGMLGIS